MLNVCHTQADFILAAEDIDRPPTPKSIARAKALITASCTSDATTTTHPLLPPAPGANFSPLIESELNRIASKTPLSAIDLSRYEASPTPSSDTSPSDAKQILQAAYTNASYLTLRLQALELLEQFGKNAWLVGNSQLEDVLRDVEKELVETRERTEVVNRERKGMQEGARGRLDAAGEEWRTGVGRVIEVSVAVKEKEGEWREKLKG
ncbi:hypothetical protein ACLMJK_000549 [Lecanora helva]